MSSNEDRIYIESYRIADLSDSKISDFYKDDRLPISRQRAVSQRNNPNADPEDIVLLIARQNDVIVSYLGILPDKMYGDYHTPQKIGWLSCWWVDPEANVGGVACMLLLRALGLYKNAIAISAFSDEAKEIYDRLGFFKSLEKKGFQYQLRVDSDLSEKISRKVSRLFSLPRLMRLCTPALGLLLSPLKIINLYSELRYRQWHWSNHVEVEALSFKIIDSIDEETDKMLDDLNVNKAFRKTKSELDWISAQPWIIPHSAVNKGADKYYFSYHDSTFRSIYVRVEKFGKIVGFMLVSLRRAELRVPIFYAYQASDLVSTILALANRFKAESIVLYEEELTSAFQKSDAPYLYKQNISNLKYFHKKIYDAKNLSSSSIFYGDGDVVFT